LENPDAFFPLVDAITDPDVVPSVHTMTPEAIRQFVLATARKEGHLLVPGTTSMVDMQLGLHAATPKIQAFYHHYAEIDDSRKPKCGSWVDWYGRAICDVETLVQLTNLDTIDAEAGLNS
jgi:UDP-glucose:glycoprotein glucosyltransferase